MASGIRSTYARDTYIRSNCAMGIWIWCASVRNIYTGDIYTSGAYVGDIEPKTLTRSGVTLKSLGIIFIYASINNYYL